MLNYSDLSDVEFEYLAQDIMQSKLGIPLHRFGKGCDGGIDLVDNIKSKDIVVQVKHYIKTSVAGLISALREEIPKVEAIKPKSYFVVCSRELTPAKTEEIYNMFSDYMKSSQNILSLTDIDDYLSLPENVAIVRKHFKLWLHTASILTDLLNQDVFIDSQVLLSNIEEDKRLFVQTEAYNAGLDCIEKARILFFCGDPGTGKTITSKMLVLYYAINGYRVRYSTDGADLKSLKKALSESPSMKEIILLDDCLGQYYFNMKETQENELLSLIRFIRVSPNKILILNSRVTILNEARARNPEFCRSFETKEFKVHILDMDNMTLLEKAKIFYNHLYFSGLPDGYFNNIKCEKRYLKIISHPNYSPRIIEYVVSASYTSNVDPGGYYQAIMNTLSKPDKIWENEYVYRIKQIDRMLLCTLFSLTDTFIESALLEICFNYYIRQANCDLTINNFLLAIKRLNGSMIRVISDRGVSKVGMSNPSLNDYMNALFCANSPEKESMRKAICTVPQALRLFEKEVAQDYLKQAFLDLSILEFYFESEDAKKDFIIWGVCTFSIMDEAYKPYILSYLQNVHDASCYELAEPSQTKLVECLITMPLIEYYQVGEFLSQLEAVSNLLLSFDLHGFVIIANLLFVFYQQNCSDHAQQDFIRIARIALQECIETLYGEIDASEEADGIDISQIIENNIRYYGPEDDYEAIDYDAAADELEFELIEGMKESIADCISQLPKSISAAIDVENDICFEVYNTETVIGSYYEPDYDDFYEGPINDSTDPTEINLIFDR